MLIVFYVCLFQKHPCRHHRLPRMWRRQSRGTAPGGWFTSITKVCCCFFLPGSASSQTAQYSWLAIAQILAIESTTSSQCGCVWFRVASTYAKILYKIACLVYSTCTQVTRQPYFSTHTHICVNIRPRPTHHTHVHISNQQSAISNQKALCCVADCRFEIAGTQSTRGLWVDGGGVDK
jgi:hypothetical protein